MSLREILSKIAKENHSEPMLKRTAHIQSGLYIAEINDKGYLGQVLYKIKPS